MMKTVIVILRRKADARLAQAAFEAAFVAVKPLAPGVASYVDSNLLSDAISLSPRAIR